MLWHTVLVPVCTAILHFVSYNVYVLLGTVMEHSTNVRLQQGPGINDYFHYVGYILADRCYLQLL